MKRGHGIFLSFLFFSAFFLFFDSTFAGTGFIDVSATNQAKVCHNVVCDDFGIINFELYLEPSIAIDSDSGITGNVWGDELGWINFAPTGSGVTFANKETGLLTGYAWSQVSGWINFAPTGQSVVINGDTGEFQGYAWTGGAYGGWIKFDCADASTCVRTTWRADHVTVVLSDGGGAISPPPPSPPPPSPPDEPTDINPPPPPDEPILPDLPPPSLPPPDGPNGPGDDGGGGFIPDLKNRVQVELLDLIDKLLFLIKSPIGNLISRIVTILGLLAGVFTLFSLGDIGLNLLRLWSFFLYSMGFKKRNRPWGVVYDSVTKQPLDPAYVILNDMEGREIGSSITDLDGRYGFLVSPGIYRIVASKTNYTYPSLKLTGRTSDELYNDLYFGEQIEVKEEGEIIAKNIPLDQIGFDWNEFAKKEQKRMKFYHTRDVLLARFSDSMFFLGFVVSIVILFVVPKPYNIIIFCLYIVLLFLRRTTVRRNKKGRVVYKVDNTPISYGILRVCLATTGQEIARRVLDKTGNYYCLVPNGTYNVSIEKKNDDSSYTKIFTSPVLEVKEGILKKDFRI